MMGFLSHYDQRTRMVILLAGATVLALAIAVFFVNSSVERSGPTHTPGAFFPELTSQLDSVTRIELADADSAITLERGEDGLWRHPDKDNYPASVRPLRALFEGLRGLQALTPKTANPEWHGFLDLEAPEQGGKSVRISLSDQSGNRLAGLLLGKPDETGEVSGRDRFHVRRIDDNQTWLVSGQLPRDMDVADWLDTQLFEITRQDIHRTEITLATKEPFTLQLPDRQSADYSLSPLPEGRTLREPYIVNGIATAITNIDIEDVLPRDALGVFTFVGTFTYQTFDGLVIDVEQMQRAGEEDYWLSFSARAVPPLVSAEGEKGKAATESGEAGSVTGEADQVGSVEATQDQTPQGAISAEVGAMVNRINGLAKGRAFRVPSYQAEQMAKSIEDLLEAEASPEDEESSDDVGSAEDPEE